MKLSQDTKTKTMVVSLNTKQEEGLEEVEHNMEVSQFMEEAKQLTMLVRHQWLMLILQCTSTTTVVKHLPNQDGELEEILEPINQVS